MRVDQKMIELDSLVILSFLTNLVEIKIALERVSDTEDHTHHWTVSSC